jgi:hypothetical protein
VEIVCSRPSAGGIDGVYGARHVVLYAHTEFQEFEVAAVWSRSPWFLLMALRTELAAGFLRLLARRKRLLPAVPL